MAEVNLKAESTANTPKAAVTSVGQDDSHSNRPRIVQKSSARLLGCECNSKEWRGSAKIAATSKRGQWHQIVHWTRWAFLLSGWHPTGEGLSHRLRLFRTNSRDWNTSDVTSRCHLHLLRTLRSWCSLTNSIGITTQTEQSGGRHANVSPIRCSIARFDC